MLSTAPRKVLKVIPLLVLSACTSATIIIDASEWYGNLYNDITFFHLGIPKELRGVVFAAILELFLAVMMAVRLPPMVTKAGRRIYHPANAVMWVLALCCFAVIFYGTRQGIIEGKEDRFTVSTSVQKQITSTDKALKRVQTNKRLFGCLDKDDNPVPNCKQQRGNLALAIREEQRLQKQLEGKQAKTEKTTDSGSTQLDFLGLAKFVMLSANLISLWLIGWTIRNKPELELDDGPDLPDELSLPDQDVGELIALDEPPVVELPVVVEPPPPLAWTKDDFLAAFKRVKAASSDILAATGLTQPELVAVVRNTSKVLAFIRRREQEGIDATEQGGNAKGERPGQDQAPEVSTEGASGAIVET